MKNLRIGRQVERSGVRLLVAMTIGLVGFVLPFSGHQWYGQATLEATTRPGGAELFKTHCASCHGVEGTGNGPMAHTLRHEPADLTLIAKRNGGMFPTARVNRIVAGRDIESHGDREMPVWGDAFTITRDGGSRESVDARIAAIVNYLERIQHRDSQ
jgi:mono/diheme cytochrome c family protein